MPDEQQPESRERWIDAQRRAAGYRAQVLFRSAEGDLVPHRIELSPLQIVDGRVVRWIGTAREDTAREQPTVRELLAA